MTTSSNRLLSCVLLLACLAPTACDDTAKTPTKTAKADAEKADAKADDKGAAKADDKGAAKADDKGTAEADDKDEETPSADGADDPAAADADAPAEDDAFAGYDPRVAQAAKLAEGISTDPQKADELLAAASLDRDKLDALMYEIANDPDLTAQYRMARGI